MLLPWLFPWPEIFLGPTSSFQAFLKCHLLKWSSSQRTLPLNLLSNYLVHHISLYSNASASSQFQEPGSLLPCRWDHCQSRPGIVRTPVTILGHIGNQSPDLLPGIDPCAWSVHTAKAVCGWKLESGACILWSLTPNLKSQIPHIPWAHLLFEVT